MKLPPETTADDADRFARAAYRLARKAIRRAEATKAWGGRDRKVTRAVQAAADARHVELVAQLLRERGCTAGELPEKDNDAAWDEAQRSVLYAVARGAPPLDDPTPR